jgi:hypothetical protein
LQVSGQLNKERLSFSIKNKNTFEIAAPQKGILAVKFFGSFFQKKLLSLPFNGRRMISSCAHLP